MSDDFDNEGGQTRGGGFDIGALVRVAIDRFRTYHLLLWVLILLFVLGAFVFIGTASPTYTATAVIGPSTSLDTLTSANPLQQVARRIRGGGLLGGGGGNESFDEFNALLGSTRLADRLSQVPGVMQAIFSDQWDAQGNRWIPPDDGILNQVRRLLGRPIKPAPDVDDLKKFLGEHMISSVALETGYATVTFKYGNHNQTERLLNQILLAADNIIREDKRRDVGARIGYLAHALADVTFADQKTAMIGTLSEQQQQMMMIQSDHRYASILIDPPHAPIRPTSPVPTIDLGGSVLLAIGVWYLLVFLAKPGTWLYRSLEIFARHRWAARVAQRENAYSA